MGIKLTHEVVGRFIVVHGNRYDYSLVDYTGSKIKVKIICQEHGVFEQIPNSHLNGSGCSACAGVKPLNNEVFIKKLINYIKINMIIAK